MHKLRTTPGTSIARDDIPCNECAYTCGNCQHFNYDLQLTVIRKLNTSRYVALPLSRVHVGRRNPRRYGGGRLTARRVRVGAVHSHFLQAITAVLVGRPLWTRNPHVFHRCLVAPSTRQVTHIGRDALSLYDASVSRPSTHFLRCSSGQ